MLELATEYLHSAELLTQRIKRLNADLKDLTGKEYLNTQQRLYLLQQEYYDTRSLGLFLLRQYGE